MKIGFVGLGLIGGSILRSIKEKHPDYHTLGFSRSQAPLLLAKEEGMLDEIVDCLDERMGSVDYIFLCTPVEYIASYLEKLKPVLSSHTILTDVGSVKGYILNAVKKEGLEANYIGGHPMAGSEKTGYANSSSLLLENAFYAICPTDLVDPKKVEELVELVRDMGALPVVMDAFVHDKSVAGISHVPHIIASSLVNLVKQNDNEEQMMKRMAAGGFKDITRIASSSPEMWEQICSTNAEAISNLLGKYIALLQEAKDAVDGNAKSYVHEMFESSKEYRDAINDNKRGAKGPIQPFYGFYCDLKDEEGSIALVANILAFKQVSIKNIGIVHYREFTRGALLIEFYREDAMELAEQVLTEHGYTIYK
ncbi:MAG: prephenate dehydrogenase [Lachnospiraceae bacterium]|nr:prephenate dehydrogenase [Lachnospiraceae bacterium]